MLDFSPESETIVMCCIYLSLLNSLNMVVLFMYRQQDLRKAAFQAIKGLFCESVNHNSNTDMIGFRGT
uniref:G_PROTEIN_RECEP_F1_2 domain-containing protein n=1 Tax=Elaeophora elaphi TaxID=1147741 RepID=A0A0R3RP18_9BILA